MLTSVSILFSKMPYIVSFLWYPPGITGKHETLISWVHDVNRIPICTCACHTSDLPWKLAMVKYAMMMTLTMGVEIISPQCCWCSGCKNTYTHEKNTNWWTSRFLNPKLDWSINMTLHHGYQYSSVLWDWKTSYFLKLTDSDWYWRA